MLRRITPHHITKYSFVYDLRQHKQDPAQMRAHIQSTPFDQFTHSLSDPTYLATLHRVLEHHSKFISQDGLCLRFPWSFQQTPSSPPPERNLLCCQDYSAFLDEETVLNLYDRFLDDLKNREVDHLLDYVEKSLKKRIGKMHQEFMTSQYSIEIETSSIKRQVELTGVRNIFGVGLYMDRQKNDPADKYRVFDTLVDVNGIGKQVPTRNIIKMRPSKNEMASLLGQFDLWVFSGDRLLIKDAQGQVVAASHSHGWRSLTLETLLWQMPYRTFKKNKAHDHNQLISNATLKKKRFIITDFEAFMGPNELLHR